MTAMEHLKNLILVGGIDTNPVVANGKNPLLAAGSSRNMYLRLHPGTPVFNRVADQVLEHLFQCDVGVDFRQTVVRDRSAAGSDRRFQVFQNEGQDLLAV